MKNQSLKKQKIPHQQPRKRGRPPGSRSKAFSRQAVLQELEIANEERRKAGLTEYDLEHFSIVGQMTRAAVKHDFALEKNWDDLTPAQQVDGCRISMGLWREVAPYEERKAPALTVEEIREADAPESESQSMEAWVYAQVRKQNSEQRVAELAAADAERHNYQEPE